MRRVAIVQSNYLPWKGYFDLIGSVDAFVLYDDVQFTRRDWRNRNKIKTPGGPRWITVPVRSKGRYHQPIRQVEIEGTDWAAEHLRAIELNYAKARYAGAVLPWIAGLYADPPALLSELNRGLIVAIRDRLGIETPILDSASFELAEDRTERLAGICRQLDADVYVSGPAARSYLDESVFASRGMGVEWFDYAGYPEYPQLWGAFEHGVSVLDLLLNCGPDARSYMKVGR